MTRRILLTLLCLGCVYRGSANEEFAPRFPDRSAFQRYVEEGRISPFGLDYVFVHNPAARNRELVDEVTGKTGVRWVNLAKLEWRNIERRPPKIGRHTYNWSDLDAAVRAWQRNGVHIMVSLRFNSPWATAPADDSEFVYLRGPAKALALRTADYLPKPEHMKDLREYARNLVERYDGDGADDMPGLLFPVIHFQVGNEYYNEVYWAGSAEEYGLLLCEFAGGARAANPKVKIVLSGIGFEDIPGFYGVEMAPLTEAYVKNNLPKVSAGMKPFLKRGFEFSRETLAFHDAWDILDARWPNYGIVAGSRELLKQAGCPDRDIWSAEIYSGFPLMEPLVLPNWTLQAWPTPSRSKDYMKILKSPKHPDFEKINRWYRGLHAAQIVKICMVALDAGSRKLMMGWAADVQTPLAVSTLSHHGLYSATFKKMWPAGYTYGLTIKMLDGLKSLRRLTSPKNVYLYECLCQGNRRVLVAFFDDHIAQDHDVPTGEVTTTVPIQTGQAKITRIITEIDQTEPKTVLMDSLNGGIRLKLTEYPVFIEPIGPG